MDDFKEWYQKTYIENKDRFLLGLFLLSMSEDKPRTYTISASDELFATLGIYGGYDVEEHLQELFKDKPFYYDIDWDSESGCFFCYTTNPKTVVEIMNELVSRYNAQYNEEVWERFLNHPENRLRIIT